jgi:hypothetical protein
MILPGYDYRGYGNSGGVSNQHDIRKDAQAYIRFIRGAYSKHQRIFFRAKPRRCGFDARPH